MLLNESGEKGKFYYAGFMGKIFIVTHTLFVIKHMFLCFKKYHGPG